MMGRAFIYGHGGYGCGSFGGFGVFPIMLLVLIVLAVIFALFAKRKWKYKEDSEALEILNQRLVKGEITIEEYERLKKVMKH